MQPIPLLVISIKIQEEIWEWHSRNTRGEMYTVKERSIFPKPKFPTKQETHRTEPPRDRNLIYKIKRISKAICPDKNVIHLNELTPRSSIFGIWFLTPIDWAKMNLFPLQADSVCVSWSSSPTFLLLVDIQGVWRPFRFLFQTFTLLPHFIYFILYKVVVRRLVSKEQTKSSRNPWSWDHWK